MPVELLPANPLELDTLARLWQRESRLLPLALYLTAEELNGEAAGPAGPLNRFLSRSDGVFFVGVREILPHLGQAHVAFDIAKPTAAEQKTAWRAALGDNGQDNAALLAGQFNLNLPTIHELARLAKTEANDSNAPLAGKIWEICCASERPRLDALAQRLEPKVTWDDLVLPAEEMNRLKEIAAQVKHRNQVYCEWGFERKMNRGFSISALFAGDSGTGKTMAAEVIANELRLNLYRIDLSAVVNKYIGETEKNLRRLFDAAEGGGAILFFDEADALFGKRSEVKDSHDRYANIEINYLLQRIESYRGLAILATNMKSALDTAFMRRLRFIVNFPYPTVADRRRLWEKVFLQPDAKQNLAVPPLDELDYEHLARLNLTGGHIHSAALNAAFRAAAAGSNVTMRLVLDAVRTELLKLDRPVNDADFRWTEPAPDAAEAGRGNRRTRFRMNINLHIERLMLDGLSIAQRRGRARADGGRSGAGAVAHKEPLCGRHRHSPEARVAAREIHPRRGVSARELGVEIGRSVFASLTPYRVWTAWTSEARARFIRTSRFASYIQSTIAAALRRRLPEANFIKQVRGRESRERSQQPFNANQQERKIVCQHRK